MALVKCPECNKEISSLAKLCPFCGAPPAKKSFGLGWLIFIVVCVYIGVKDGPSQSPATPPRDTTHDARDGRVIALGCALRSDLREPQSLEWISIHASDDGNTICYSYRARNGFGGMAVSQVIVTGKTTATSATAWNRHCANKPLTDVTWQKANIRDSACRSFLSAIRK